MEELGYILIGAGFVFGFSMLSQRPNNTLDSVERKLDLIMRHMGIEDKLDIIEDDEFNSLIQEGKTIKAIKRYRVVTGQGLKDSKDYVDALIDRKGNSNLGE